MANKRETNKRWEEDVVMTDAVDDDPDVVRIVLLSDTHGLHHKIQLPKGGDVLIHCGDFADRASLQHVQSFRDWFQSQTQFTDRIVIAGNHDRDLSNPNAINLEAEFSQKSPTIHFLQDEHIICANGRLHIFGASWKTCAEDSYEDLNLKDNEGIPVDILLSHMPPYWPSSSASQTKGSLSLAKTSFVNRIPITCGGHLHWARGAVQWVDDTCRKENGPKKSCWFINASSKQPAPRDNPRQKNDEAVFPPVLILYNVKRREVVRMEGLSLRGKNIPSFFKHTLES